MSATGFIVVRLSDPSSTVVTITVLDTEEGRELLDAWFRHWIIGVIGDPEVSASYRMPWKVEVFR